MNIDEVLSQKPYILFYEIVDCKESACKHTEKMLLQKMLHSPGKTSAIVTLVENMMHSLCSVPKSAKVLHEAQSSTQPLPSEKR